MYGITVNAHCSSNLTIERDGGLSFFYGKQCRMSMKREGYAISRVKKKSKIYFTIISKKKKNWIWKNKLRWVENFFWKEVK